MANAWHARSDAASSVVVAFGITGNLLGLHFMDLLVVFIVAKFITRMGYQFASDALHDLMGHSVDAQTDLATQNCLLTTNCVLRLHEFDSNVSSGHRLHNILLNGSG
ncbi:cation transporter [Citrobacter europaeus]|uniref:cation transporter n=1 Tax=Citrobacter TaxID=544 RepID=UPI001E59FB5B